MSPKAMPAAVAAALIALPGSASAQGRGPGAPWDSIGRALGTAGAVNAGTVRYNFPRGDLTVRIGDVTVAPAVALVTWAGFGVMGSDTVVMGDVVVTAEELFPVLRAFAGSGIEVTAVHNHLAGEEPRLTYIHFMGMGSALGLSDRVRAAIAWTGAPLPPRPPPPRAVAIDTALLFRVMGASGRANGDVAQLSFNLVPGGVTHHGRAVPMPLGYASPINVQRVSDDRVVATGDFAIVGAKVAGVLEALAFNGITATAVHSHMLGDTPTITFIHFWADGPLGDVARGLRAALDSARP